MSKNQQINYEPWPVAGLNEWQRQAVATVLNANIRAVEAIASEHNLHETTVREMLFAECMAHNFLTDPHANPKRFNPTAMLIYVVGGLQFPDLQLLAKPTINEMLRHHRTQAALEFSDRWNGTLSRVFMLWEINRNVYQARTPDPTILHIPKGLTAETVLKPRAEHWQLYVALPRYERPINNVFPLPQTLAHALVHAYLMPNTMLGRHMTEAMAHTARKISIPPNREPLPHERAETIAELTMALAKYWDDITTHPPLRHYRSEAMSPISTRIGPGLPDKP